MMPDRAVTLFLSREDETVLNNRLALGMPTLLVTAVDSQKSWMIGLDDICVTDPTIVSLQRFKNVELWAVEMCEFLRAKRTFSLIDGALIFYRSMREWLASDQLNDALFYVESTGPGHGYFGTVETQINRTLRN
jgi:hypothetical protein